MNRAAGPGVVYIKWKPKKTFEKWAIDEIERVGHPQLPDAHPFYIFVFQLLLTN